MKQELSPGVIEENASYTLRELAKRTGLGHSSLRLARSKGLKVRRLGRKQFCLGRDWLEFVASLAVENERGSREG